LKLGRQNDRIQAGWTAAGIDRYIATQGVEDSSAQGFDMFLPAIDAVYGTCKRVQLIASASISMEGFREREFGSSRVGAVWLT
jgi:hypothetical protein